MATPAGNDPVLAQLRPLLARQLGRLRNRYRAYGLAKSVLWAAAAVSLMFVLDRWLDLPTPMRLLHSTAAAVLCVFALGRFVRYPLSRQFTDIDIAVWVERTYPELHQRLISAIQLHSAPASELRNQSRAMIDQLWRETAEQARDLRFEQLFDNRALARVLAGAAALTALLAFGAAAKPETASTFVLRHLGVQKDYPRYTYLKIVLPEDGQDLQRVDRDAEGETEIVIPAGADLHVSVLVDKGLPPKTAELVLRTLRADGTLGDERSIPMTPRPGDRFRHVFRRISGQFQFRAKGGDDKHGDRLVIVRTVRPAQVATLTATISPPAYTGVERIEQQGGAVEALIGSDVEIKVEVTAPVREAELVFLESGRRVLLEPFSIQDDSGTSTGFVGSFVLENSDRYQVELIAESGLRNPKPGTYPISALQDYAPVGRWLLPEDDSLALLTTGLLCLRVDTRDDFGLTAVELSVERGGAVVLTQPLLPAQDDQSAPVTRYFPTKLFEVSDLLGSSEGGEGLFINLSLRDNRVPEAGTVELPRRIVQIVDPQQLAGLIAKRFRRLREEVEQAASIQLDRSERLSDLIARQADPKEAATAGEVAQILTGVEVGQGRIQSAVQRVSLGLIRAFDLHLWNRLEPSQHAASVIALFEEHAAGLAAPLAIDPEFYRDLLARRKTGSLGAMETTLDPILTMFEMTDSVAQGHAREVVRLLAQAQVARGDADRVPLLAEVAQRQQRIQEILTQLLLRLEEWNDYQDLVQEVRALRDRQRDLQNRTEEARGK